MATEARSGVVGRAIAIDVLSTGLVLLVVYFTAIPNVTVFGAAVTALFWFSGVLARDAYCERELRLHGPAMSAFVTIAGWLGLGLGLVAWLLGIQVDGYLVTVLLLFSTSFVARRCLWAWVQHQHRLGRLRTPVVLRAAFPDAMAVVGAFAADPALPFEVKAFRSTAVTASSLEEAEQGLLDLAAEGNADTLFLVGEQPESALDLRRLVWRLESRGMQVSESQWPPP